MPQISASCKNMPVSTQHWSEDTKYDIKGIICRIQHCRPHRVQAKLPSYCKCELSICISSFNFIVFSGGTRIASLLKHTNDIKSFGDRQSIHVCQATAAVSELYFSLTNILWFQSDWINFDLQLLTCWRWRGVFQRRAPDLCCWESSGADQPSGRTLLLSVPYPGNFPTLPAHMEKKKKKTHTDFTHSSRNIFSIQSIQKRWNETGHSYIEHRLRNNQRGKKYFNRPICDILKVTRTFLQYFSLRPFLSLETLIL